MTQMELAERLVDRARRAGAEEAEAYVEEARRVDIKVREGSVETVSYTNTSGYGLRVLIDGKLGFASSNNLDAEEAQGIIKRLVAQTAYETPDEHNVLPAPLGSTMSDSSLEQYDETLSLTPVEKKIKLAIALETAAREADRRIVNVPWAQYGDSAKEYAVVSSRGIAGQGRRTEIFGAVIAAGMSSSSEGQPDPSSVQTGIGVDVKAIGAEFDPEATGRKAAAYAVRMLGASDGSTDEMEGVFPPETGSEFIKLIADMTAADLVQKKKSLFAGKLGTIVASDSVTIIDDGRLKKGLGSSAIDAEGVPTTTTKIIANGRLVGLMHDSYTAHRAGTALTGNAQREAFDAKPVIGPTNFYLAPGKRSRENLMASVKKGLFITEVSGLHASVDQVTGDFSIPSKGIMIVNGELTTPLRNITISGNIFDFLGSVDAVADDLSWEPRENVIGAPTFKVRAIKISGK